MTRSGRATTGALVAASLALASLTAAQGAGALAIGACGAYGFAYDFAAEQAARSAALRNCEGNCSVVAEVRRNCAAFAVDLKNVCGSYGFAAAARLGLAQDHALRQCHLHGGKDCVLRAYVCDARG